MGEAWPVKVRYTRRALDQLSKILDYIEARSPQGAKNVKQRLDALLAVLADHPLSGRSTNRIGVRRIVAHPYPYLIIYKPSESEVVVLSVRHAARRPSG